MKHLTISFTFLLCLGGASIQSVGALSYNVDRDHDGVITRSEWPGNERSFQNRDWNRDGVLSGQEVSSNDQSWQQPAGYESYRPNEYQFRSFDRNSNDEISRNEWRGDWDTFERLDDNRNGELSRAEYFNRAEPQKNDRFSRMDDNDDDRLSLAEWGDTRYTFERVDRDNDGWIDRREFSNPPKTTAVDNAVDVVDTIFKVVR